MPIARLFLTFCQQQFLMVPANGYRSTAIGRQSGVPECGAESCGTRGKVRRFGRIGGDREHRRGGDAQDCQSVMAPTDDAKLFRPGIERHLTDCHAGARMGRSGGLPPQGAVRG